MGSATTQALTASRGAVSRASKVTLETAENVLEVGRLIGSSPALLAALTSFEGDGSSKTKLVSELFSSSLTSNALSIVEVLASRRWSSPEDLLFGIEDAGIRLASRSTSSRLDEEILGFAHTVSLDHELELALGSKLSPVEAKLALVGRLLEGKASPETLAIVRHLVAQPRGRRIGAMLTEAAAITADEAGFVLATVTVAQPLSSAQTAAIEKSLHSRYSRPVRINLVVNEAVMGGVKIQVGDEVIDGTIATRLTELRLNLVG